MENLILIIIAILLCVFVVKVIARTAVRLVAIALIIVMTLAIIGKDVGKIPNPFEEMTNALFEMESSIS